MHFVSGLICALVRRFHLLKPEYIYHRIKQLQKSFQLRIILCYVDVDDVVEALGQVRYAKACPRRIMQREAHARSHSRRNRACTGSQNLCNMRRW